MDHPHQPVESEEEPLLNIDIRRYLATVRRYVWLLAALVVLAIAGAIVYTTRLTPIYEARASVQIEPRIPDLLGTGDMFNVAAGNNTNEYYKQQRQVLGSYTLAKQTVIHADLTAKLLSEHEMKALTLDERVEVATRKLSNLLSIRYPDQNRIMYVTVRNANPELAATIANNHVSTYVSYAKGLLSINSNQASNALLAEFKEAEAKLRAAEDKIYKFQSENDMIAVTLEEHQNLVSTNILAFTQKLNDARAEEISLGARLAELKKQAGAEVLESPVSVMSDDSAFQQLRSLYYTEKIKLIEMSKDLGSKNPDLIAQQQKVDEVLRALSMEVKILITGTEKLHAAAVAKHAGLEVEVERYKLEAKRLSPKIVQYNEYLREKKQIEDEYNILRNRLSTSQLTGNMSSVISNVRPLDPALVPQSPIWPRMPRNIAIAVAFAFVIGFTIVFLMVFLDRSIKSAPDAIQAASAPVLGFIPALTESEVPRNDVRARDMYLHEHPSSHIAECCRALRTNVMFSATGQDTDAELKTIVVCSANAQEGKTTTVMYLGTTMAQSGQRVLLIDSDMRRPRLHVSTGVKREPGLSTLILGEDNYDEVIKATEIPNLFVLPCGPLPPNPAELLMTKRFEAVLSELGRRFSRIILDSPPLQPVTDGIVLSRQSDGVIIVVRSGRTIRDELKRSAKMVRGVNGRILGVVINDRQEREDGYYYSSYGYSQIEESAKAS